MALDKKILEDLEVGCASLRFVAKVDTLADTTFDSANEIFTVEGTLSIDQAEPSKNEIKVDQLDGAVGVNYETGEFTIKGTVPSVAIPLFDEFYDKSTTQPTLTGGITGSDGTTKYKKGHGYDLNSKRKRVTLMIESESRKTAIAFMNVEMVVSLKWGNVKTDPIGIEITGTVLANTKAGAPSFVILKQS